MLVEYVWL